MNLLARLAMLLTFGRFRHRVPALGPCRTAFRVWPTDLDVLMHVNNGVYLSMMDLGRMDLMLRSGLLKGIRANGWYPVVTAQTIQYRRSLKLFQRFHIVTRVLWWDEKHILLEQQFERGSDPVAYALIRARFLSNKGESVSISDLMALAGSPSQPSDTPDWALRWNSEQTRFQARKLS